MSNQVRTRSSDERLVTGYTGRLLTTTVLGTTMVMAGRLVIPPLLPRIQADIGISGSEAGVALSLMWAMTALFQFPGGRLSDQLSRKTVLVGSILLFVSGLTLLATVPTALTFVVGVAVIGAGAGLYLPAAFALLSDLFVERRGQAFGINAGGIDLGGALAGGIAVAALAVATWQAAFLPAIAVLVAVAALLHLQVDQPYELSGATMEVRATAGRLLGTRRLRRTLVALSLFAFAWQGIINFLPTLLTADKGFSEALAGNVFALVFAVGVVLKPAAGRLGDRYGFPTVAAGAPLITVIGLVLLAVAEAFAVLVVGVLLAAVGLAVYFPAMSTHLMNVLPEGDRGGDFGAGRTVFFAVGSAGPTFVGFVGVRATYTRAFLGLAVFLVLSSVVTAWLARTGSSPTVARG